MTPVNTDVVDRIIEAVYKKYGLLLSKDEVLIDNYLVIRDSITEPLTSSAVYIVEIEVAGKLCRISLHKGDDMDKVLENQINQQNP